MLKVELRMSGSLYDQIRLDIARPHSHALERVGFAFGHLSKAGEHTSIVHLLRYRTVSDERYIRSKKFGALIDDKEVLQVMQEIRKYRGTGYGAFHVHLHSHSGQPSFSRPDLQSLPDLVPPFSRMDSSGVSGLLLLSQDHAIAKVWLPGQGSAVNASPISVIGTPIRIFHMRFES